MSPVTIKLQPSGRCEPENGHRVWDVTITPGQTEDSESTQRSKRLQDYFTKQKYEAYERFVLDLERELKKKEQASGPPSLAPEPSENAVSTTSEYPQASWPPSLIVGTSESTAASEPSIVEYSPNSSLSTSLTYASLEDEIRNYRKHLENWLDLRRWAAEKEIKIYICETLDSADLDDPSYPSIHSLLWECIESSCWPEEPVPNRNAQERQSRTVHITRVIIHKESPPQLPKGLRFREETIKLLVVVARHFGKRHHKYWSLFMFDDPPSVVQDTLVDLVRYLRANGRASRLQVDVLRPGTLNELDSHLARHSYDMVHLDLHGDVGNGPILCFAKPFSKEQKHQAGGSTGQLGYHYTPVNASEVAGILKKRNITVVVLSACLSSWAHSRPLSNMCHVFANHGVKAVTGMSFSVLYDAAHAYFEEFYRRLVLENMGFRASSLKARETLQGGAPRGYAIPHCWPVVTTYYTTRSLERAETGLLGIGMEPHNPEISDTFKPSKICWKLFWSFCCLVVGFTSFKGLLDVGLNVLHAALIAVGVTFGLQVVGRHATTYSYLTEKEKDSIPSVTRFEEFQAHTRRLRPPMRHSVGLMALEDRLKTQGKLLLVVEPTLCPTLCGHGKEKRIQYIRDVWLTTNFADEVQDFDARSFSRSSYRAWQAMSTWRQNKDNKEARSGVLIFYNMEKVLRNSSALEAINLLIAHKERIWSRGCYLLLISSRPWTGESLQPSRRKWVLAESFSAIEHFNIFFPYETDNDPP